MCFIRWPAIIVPDVSNSNVHIWKDFDGEPLEYHVEYLGKSRSHGWINSNSLDLYYSVPNDEQMKGTTKQKEKCKQKRRKVKINSFK